jgi:hypothetical protein
MLKLFKRWGGAPVTPTPQSGERAKPRRADATHATYTPAEPLPVPEVVAEGNDHSDWSLWEDSVQAVDSQLQGLVPSTRIYVRDTAPSQLDDLDPFGGVRVKRAR